MDGTRIGALDFIDFEDVHDTMPEYVADMTGIDPHEIRHLRAASEEQRRAQEDASRALVGALKAMSTS